MGVDPADTGSSQPASINHGEHLVVSSHLGWGQVFQKSEDLFPFTELPQGDLTDHERMGKDRSLLELHYEASIAMAKVVDPD